MLPSTILFEYATENRQILVLNLNHLYNFNLLKVLNKFFYCEVIKVLFSFASKGLNESATEAADDVLNLKSKHE